MKTGWDTSSFEGCIEDVRYTRKIQRKDFLPEGEFPIISQEDDFVNGYWNNGADLYKIPRPVIVFGDHTKVLKYVDFDFVLGADGVKILQPRHFLLPKFFYYQLMAANLKSLGYARHYKLLKELEIGFPPLPEQRRIVGILDEAFAGIATAKDTAEKNIRNARAIYEIQLTSVFRRLGEQSVDTALGEICEFVRGPFGGSLKKAIFVEDGYAVYEQQHAIYDQFDDVRYFVNEAKFTEMKRFEVSAGDLIMSCSGTMGRVAIVPKGVKRGIINQALLKLTPSRKISGKFLKFWMRSEAFQDALKEYSGGAAIQNVASVKTLKEIKVPLPPVTDQRRVVDELDALHVETKKLSRVYERKLAALEELKKSLLHQAFNGEL